MTRFRLLSEAFLLSALFVSQIATADKGVFNARITPDEFFTNTPTTITISAEIGIHKAKPNSIIAYQTTADGKTIAILGKMTDDGTQGDARAADAIFSTQFNLERPSRETLYARIEARYENDQMAYLSPMMAINTYEAISTNTVADFEQTLKTIKNSFLQRLDKMPMQTTREQAVQDSKQNPIIKQAQLNGVFLSILFNNGVRGSVTLDGYNWPTSDTNTTETPSPIQPANHSKVLIFAPGYNDSSPQNEIADYALQRFNQSEYLFFEPKPATITKNDTASLELAKYWGNYQAVILHTHGGVWGVPDSGQEVFLQSGTSTTGTLSAEQSLDLSTGRIGLKGVGKFVMFPGFISKHALPMKDTFFYLGACSSLYNDSLWQALKAKGAKLAFGWTDIVARGFNADRFQDLANAMLPNNAITGIASAKTAYNQITDKTNGWCLLNAICLGGHGATLSFKVATPKWRDYIFSEPGLINGGFETGDWTGWQHGGDFDFRLVSGARQHTGRHAAALGRWDMQLQGQASDNKPTGYEWFYQDVHIPANKSTLQFYWGMETYNAAHGDWFNVSIKDTSGKTLKTVFNHTSPVNNTLTGQYAQNQHWQQAKVDISPYRGQTVRIYFEHQMDGLQGQQRVYVDDVSLDP